MLQNQSSELPWCSIVSFRRNESWTIYFNWGVRGAFDAGAYGREEQSQNHAKNKQLCIQGFFTGQTGFGGILFRSCSLKLLQGGDLRRNGTQNIADFPLVQWSFEIRQQSSGVR
jgi:hypothetical protein